MPDMAESSADDARSETGDQDETDRRRTIDLLRVERGEPERRKLRRWSPPDLSVEPDKPAAGDS
jgi:hypothetical protein